jgi:hypothetical protein
MRRSFSIHARVSESEQHALQKIARCEATSPSEVIRLLIREGTEKRGLPPIGLTDLLAPVSETRNEHQRQPA